MQAILSQGPLFLICLVFLLGVVVIVHELGHYLVGRMFGAAAESFSVGFGKPIFEIKDKRNTRWRVNWFPLGGFVKFVGESQMAGDVGHVETGPIGKAYYDIPVGKRSLIALAGPFANFVLASIIYAAMLLAHGVQPQTVRVAEIIADGAAEQAGLMPGDVILSIKGQEIRTDGDFRTTIALNPNTDIPLTVIRAGAQVDLIVHPVEVVRENDFGQMVAQSTIGIQFNRVAIGDPIHYNVLEAVGGGVAQTGKTLEQTVGMLGKIVTGKMSFHTMTGPVGMGDVSRRAVNMVWAQENRTTGQKLIDLMWFQLTLCAAISVGIGFFNLLPFPVLDGGHLVFNAYEAVAGKTLPEKVQEASLTFGLILLLGLFAVITFGDIMETGIFGGAAG